MVTFLLHGILVGLVYQRIGRADTRSRRVIFSDKAVIRCVDGKMLFAFQVYDLEKKIPLLECHARCYAVYPVISFVMHLICAVMFVVSKVSDGRSSVEFQSRNMRLQNPDDREGSSLFLAFPCNVIHPIDNWSPLMPPSKFTSIS